MQREDAVIVNTIMRQALISAQEVMGENGLNAVLRSAPDLPLPGLPRVRESNGGNIRRIVFFCEEETVCPKKE